MMLSLMGSLVQAAAGEGEVGIEPWLRTPEAKELRPGLLGQDEASRGPGLIGADTSSWAPTFREIQRKIKADELTPVAALRELKAKLQNLDFSRKQEALDALTVIINNRQPDEVIIRAIGTVYQPLHNLLNTHPEALKALIFALHKKAATTTKHAIGHAIDYVIINTRLDDAEIQDLKQKAASRIQRRETTLPLDEQQKAKEIITFVGGLSAS